MGDLKEILWLKSPTSEVWLDRRTNYARSLALTSIVGYILGLGDRHPSNIMIERYSGQVLHIDFGDCFEVAMHRDKFPEKVPFRLTRMLINAMEVSGIEGNFRFTCQNTMRVMREHKDSLMAVLEAFVYDPLIGWRLLSIAEVKFSETTAETPDLPQDENSDEIQQSLSSRRSRISAARQIEQLKKEDHSDFPSGLNEKAVSVVKRVSAKLTGRDFNPDEILDVPAQVQRLIDQARSHEHLCQSYIGWCPFW